nr:ATP synthase subunit s-like protein isoform X1 [Pogona vitticeps]
MAEEGPLSRDLSKMAARMLLRHCQGLVLSPSYASSRYSSRTAGSATNSFKAKVVQFFNQHFHDLEDILAYSSIARNWKVKVKNRSYNKTRERYGKEVAAATFVLNLNGRVRCRGQKRWIHGRLKDLDICLEGIDVSGSIINFDGLENLASLKFLRYLDLSRCPSIDDWCLSRLGTLAGSLEELSLAGCHQVTEKGLACLCHLQNLKRLDVSDLPRVPYKGLVCILLEEMLPQCEIVGMDMTAWDEINQDPDAETHQDVEAHMASRSWRPT